MIFDAHNHIGHRKGLDFPVEQLIERMDAAGIDKAVVFSFPEDIDNDYVADSVRRFPDRLIGFGLVVLAVVAKVLIREPERARVVA